LTSVRHFAGGAGFGPLDFRACGGIIGRMDEARTRRLAAAIRDIPDFPKPGILFKDITPLLADPGLFAEAIALFVEANAGRAIDKVVGIDARGFLFGPVVAHAMGCGFVPVRKKGKLPYETRSVSYALEYGEATVEMHVDAIREGEQVLLIDDLLATGGTSRAAADLVEAAGGRLVGAQFLIELEFLNGREKLSPVPVASLIRFA
jgi:adenine phosphoribosyltransferase